MRRFAALWPGEEKVPSAMAQIGWTAHRVLLDSFGEDPEPYAWYAAAAAEHRWSARQLQGQIALGLHRRLGRAVTNFQAVAEK
jgi:predicted nuclease of restriction endonuclease-like (RecB) superfamily